MIIYQVTHTGKQQAGSFSTGDWEDIFRRAKARKALRVTIRPGITTVRGGVVFGNPSTITTYSRPDRRYKFRKENS